MGNALRQSKQKRSTSKKESQESVHPKGNGDVTKNVYLSLEQAALFKQLLIANAELEARYRKDETALVAIREQVHIALVAAGISGDKVMGGDLDTEKPYFTIKDSNNITKS